MLSDRKVITPRNLPFISVVAALALPGLSGCSSLSGETQLRLGDANSSLERTDISQFVNSLNRIERRVAKGKPIENMVKKELALLSSEETLGLKTKLQIRCLTEEPKNFRELELFFRDIEVIKGILQRKDLGVLSRLGDGHFARLAKVSLETSSLSHSQSPGGTQLKNLEAELDSVARLLPYLSEEQKSVAYNIFRHIDHHIQGISIPEIITLLEDDVTYTRINAPHIRKSARTRLEIKCAETPLRPTVPGLPFSDLDDDEPEILAKKQKHQRELQNLLRSNGLWKLKNSEWTYSFSHPDGSTSEWHLELDSSGEYITLRQVLRESCFAGELIEKCIERLKTSGIDTLISEALATSTQEGYDSLKSKIDSWDLPNEGPIFVQRIFPTESDPVFRGSLLSSMLMARILRERYGDRVQIRPLEFSVNLTNTLNELANFPGLSLQGATLFLDIYSHGLEEYLSFPDKPNVAPLKNLLSPHKDLFGVMRIMACFGGGLRPQLINELKASTELRPRVTLFTECKPKSVNILSPVGSTDLLRGTGCQRRLMLNLLNSGCTTFGAAMRKADEETKLDVECDAEAVIDGELISYNSLPLDNQGLSLDKVFI